MPLQRSPNSCTPNAKANGEKTSNIKSIECGSCNKALGNLASTQCGKCNKHFHNICLKTRATKNSSKVICDACDRQTRLAMSQSSSAKTASPTDKQQTANTTPLSKANNELLKEIRLIREDGQVVLRRLDSLVENVTGLENKIESVNSAINGIIDRVSGMENAIENLGKKYSELDKEIKNIKRDAQYKYNAFQESIDGVLKSKEEVEKSIAFVSDRFDHMEPMLADMNKSRTICSDGDAEVIGRLHRVEAALNKEQQQSRNNNLIISGLLKTSKPDATFWEIIDALQCKDVIRPGDVKSIEILKAKRPVIEGKSFRFFTDTMLVKFNDRKPKIELIKKKKGLGVAFAEQVKKFAPTANGRSARPREIFFRDHLTEYGMRLYQKARESKETLRFKYLWTIDGQIFMRAADNSARLKISSFEDLDKLTTAQ